MLGGGLTTVSLRYTLIMIKRFRHKGLRDFFGNLKNHYAVTVNGNWRMTFAFDGEDAVLVDYRDYH